MRGLAATVCMFAALGAHAGWYLLQPPVGEKPSCVDDSRISISRCADRMIDTAAPLSKWFHVGSFDTATSCEAASQDGYKGADLAFKLMSRDDRRDAAVIAMAIRSSAASAICVSSGDPRLR